MLELKAVQNIVNIDNHRILKLAVDNVKGINGVASDKDLCIVALILITYKQRKLRFPANISVPGHASLENFLDAFGKTYIEVSSYFNQAIQISELGNLVEDYVGVDTCPLNSVSLLASKLRSFFNKKNSVIPILSTPSATPAAAPLVFSAKSLLKPIALGSKSAITHSLSPSVIPAAAIFFKPYLPVTSCFI